LWNFSQRIAISNFSLIQCQVAKEKLKDIKIDLILVSPLERALETCEKLFSDKFDQADVIV
jgi:broad specificity phosphatase PhoE